MCNWPCHLREQAMCVFLQECMCVYVHYVLCVRLCVCLPAQLTELQKLNVVMMLLQEKTVWMVMLVMVKIMMVNGTVMAVNIDQSLLYLNTFVFTAPNVHESVHYKQCTVQKYVHAHICTACMCEYFHAFVFVTERIGKQKNSHYTHYILNAIYIFNITLCVCA